MQQLSERDLMKFYDLYQVGFVLLRLHNASVHCMFASQSAVTKSYSIEVSVHCNSCHLLSNQQNNDLHYYIMELTPCRVLFLMQQCSILEFTLFLLF